jgi:site-specific recombinase XerD
MSSYRVDVTTDPHHPRAVGPRLAPAAAINDFLIHLEQCARSPYTVRAYARGLTHFVGWLDDTALDVDVVTRSVIGDYVGVFGRGRQPRTVNHRLSVLASYFAFRIRQDDDRGEGLWYRRSNPVAAADQEVVAHRLTGRDLPVRTAPRAFRRRVPRRLPARLDPLLIARLIAAAPSARDQAILLLLCRTGQRIGDWSDVHGRHGLLGMTLADIDERQKVIAVRLKGARHDHRVPVTDDFWPVFHRYLETERGTTATGTTAVWLARRRGAGTPLSYSAFESALRSLGRKVGATVRAHQFRHTFAQGVVEITGNLKVTQALLGHAHLSTTADLYLTVDPRVLVDAVAAVKTHTDAPQHVSEPGPVRYAFAYDALTIEELEQAMTALRESAENER